MQLQPRISFDIKKRTLLSKINPKGVCSLLEVSMGGENMKFETPGLKRRYKPTVLLIPPISEGLQISRGSISIRRPVVTGWINVSLLSSPSQEASLGLIHFISLCYTGGGLSFESLPSRT